MKKGYLLLLLFIISFGFSISLKGSYNRKIDSLEVMLKNYNRSDSIRVDILNSLGYEYWVVDPASSVMHGNNALTLAQQVEYKRGEAMANRVIGVADWALGNYDQALNRLFPALKLYEDVKDSLGMANVQMNIGLVYAEQLGYQQALEYYFNAEQLFVSLNEQGRLATTYTKIGTIYTELQAYDKAFEYLTIALKIHQEQKFNYGIAEATNRLGLVFRAQGDFENALEYLHRSNNISVKIEDYEGRAKCLENLGNTYLIKGDYPQAELHLKQGLELAESLQSKKWLKDIYLDLSQLYKEQNKLSQALNYFEKYSTMKDSLFDEKKIMEIAAMRLEFEMDKQKKNIEIGKEKIRLLEQRSRNRRLWIILISSLLILGAALGYFAWSKQKAVIKRDREIQREKDALNESREELSQAKLENARLIETELTQKLEVRNKELTSYTVNFIRKNELLEEIKKDLSELESDKTSASNKVKSVLRKVNNNSSLDKDWEDFKFHFEQVHVGFFKNLLAKHQNLTTGDLRLAALVRMNLNLKEAAAILGISSESVKTSRYRLRKKLDLPKEENLVDYIIKVGSE